MRFEIWKSVASAQNNWQAFMRRDHSVELPFPSYFSDMKPVFDAALTAAQSRERILAMEDMILAMEDMLNAEKALVRAHVPECEGKDVVYKMSSPWPRSSKGPFDVWLLAFILMDTRVRPKERFLVLPPMKLLKNIRPSTPSARHKDGGCLFVVPGSVSQHGCVLHASTNRENLTSDNIYFTTASVQSPLLDAADLVKIDALLERGLA